MEKFEEMNYSGMEIVILFLQKLEKLNDKERAVLIDTIALLNKPMFVVTQ